MPISINVPEAAWAEQPMSLSGFTYTFTYAYNSTDGGVRLSISNREGKVLSGLKLMSDQALNERYLLPTFNHGQLICLKFKETDELPTLGNIGIDKEYELWYYTNDEIEAILNE